MATPWPRTPSKGVAATDIPLAGTMPATVFVAFQLMFAIITVALISGAVADRLKFSAWLVFAGLWATLVYFPVAHWVFAADGFASEHGGWIDNKLHAIDFAGGTAVHINSGVAGLVLAIVLGKRKGWPTTLFRPHNVPFVMLGAGLLWFGWFGFNAGSATSSNGSPPVDVHDHHDRHGHGHARLAAHRAHPRWPRNDAGSGVGHRRRTGRHHAVVLVGQRVGRPGDRLRSAGVVCALAVGLKFKLGFDDSLDVVGVHLIGGLAGTLLVGLVAAPEAPAINGVTGVSKGLFYGGGWDQLERQAVGAFSVLFYSAIVTLILALILKYTIGIRLTAEEEAAGIDEARARRERLRFRNSDRLGPSSCESAGKR